MALLSLKTLTQYIASAFPAAPQRTAMDFLAKRIASDVKEITAATYVVQPEDNTLVLNRAGGIAATLPAATGSGAVYRFIVATTFTGDASVVTTGGDLLTGTALLFADGGDTCVGFATAADTIRLDMFDTGNTTGGIKGAHAVFTDIAADLWHVHYVSDAAGTEATPFKNA